MSKLPWLKTIISALLLLPAVVSAADRVGDFSLLDQDGYFHNMRWYNDHAAVAFLVQANDSAATEAAVSAYDTLKSKYDAQGIEFMMLNPMGRLNRGEVAAKVDEYGVKMPVLMDDARVISKLLGVEKTGEVLLFNPTSFTVGFRGPVSQAEAAIEEILAGKDVSNPVIATNGSAVTYPESVQTVSYEKDIAPVIAENCAECHREGGIAPFAMNSHAMVQGWSPMIREVLMTKRMPPAQIDAHVGDFVNDMLISDAEMQKILYWIDAGSPNDGAIDPLAQLTWPESKWAFGEPDYIIKVPPQSVPASGVLDYRYVTVPIDIEEDKWVRASQYLAGDRTVLHHTLNSIVEPGQDQRRGFLGGGNPDQANIAAYVPGGEPQMEPPNTGGLLKAGSKLNLQLHYTTNGRETVDAGEIGLWFYPDDQIPEERMSGACACIFTQNWTDIPPHAKAFEQTQSITLTREAELHSMLSHMHFRGKYMRFYADYPDGSREELLNIADYDYAWQLGYQLREPKLMPAGTVLTAVGAFDNSAQNPMNPDPDRSVPWGQQSWDEMFFGSFRWKYTDQGGGD
ncbi:MAG: redoxin domain-containing protein [Gammaproteobacteria bacterium]|nr:redoxin domain-containing protein [Gammaproteobacteria bacterium]